MVSGQIVLDFSQFLLQIIKLFVIRVFFPMALFCLISPIQSCIVHVICVQCAPRISVCCLCFMPVSVFQPSNHESYIPFMPNVLKVFLENGQTKSFKYDNKTTVKVGTIIIYILSGSSNYDSVKLLQKDTVNGRAVSSNPS